MATQQAASQADPSKSDTGEPGAGEPGAGESGAAAARARTARLRRRLAAQLVFELALPLGSYYGLRAAGLGEWLAMAVGGALLLPWIVYGIVRQRRLEAMAVFTLSLVVVGTVLTLVTGSPRVLMIRDSWLTAAIGLWIVGTLFTRRPFIMTASRGIVIAKVGEAGLASWEAKWDAEPAFRHHLRLVSAVWGGVFLLDALLRVVLAYTIPVDSFPLVSTVLWLALLGGLLTWHNWYLTRHGLKL
ncbi:VC0807 family protein [Streptomyces sp. NRRL F-4489]|uniref:VC0807 family protein n=1 Tax=Streptomyces sp. NRRL F-4489 TaxID=1609095 RepID=UPI001F2108DF|nr:VC0807 family protein [Streptomyces sp. NRRL F-4489]